jgi:hypothetical protein
MEELILFQTIYGYASITAYWDMDSTPLIILVYLDEEIARLSRNDFQKFLDGHITKFTSAEIHYPSLEDRGKPSDLDILQFLS